MEYLSNCKTGRRPINLPSLPDVELSSRKLRLNKYFKNVNAFYKQVHMFQLFFLRFPLNKPVVCRLLLKCGGTRAETRFRLSAKRTSPFKSAWVSVQSTTGS